MRRFLTVLAVLLVMASSSFVAFAAGSALQTPEQSIDLATHPMTGTWLAMAQPPVAGDPLVPTPSVFRADGTVLLVFSVAQKGMNGVEYNAAGTGVWEPVDDHMGHFTVVQVISDAKGTFTTTITIDGYLEISDDGQSFLDDGSRSVITIRDASGAIVDVIGDDEPVRPVAGTRMGVDKPGF